MKNKRASHVGMIISFVIFVTFIVFLYGVMKPTINTGQDKKDLIGYIEMQIIKDASASLTTASVNLDDKNEDNSCVYLSGFFTLIQDYIPSAKIFVKNEENSDQFAGEYSSVGSSNLAIKRTTNNKFFKVYYSLEFLEKSIITDNCKKIEEDGYNVGSITIDKYVFLKKITNLKTTYESLGGYEQLKNDLNIPPGSEFEFTFKPAVGYPISVDNGLKEPNDIYVEETPIQYVDESANIQSGFIRITGW
jgi:hypothetical protein